MRHGRGIHVSAKLLDVVEEVFQSGAVGLVHVIDVSVRIHFLERLRHDLEIAARTVAGVHAFLDCWTDKAATAARLDFCQLDRPIAHLLIGDAVLVKQLIDPLDSRRFAVVAGPLWRRRLRLLLILLRHRLSHQGVGFLEYFRKIVVVHQGLSKK